MPHTSHIFIDPTASDESENYKHLNAANAPQQLLLDLGIPTSQEWGDFCIADANALAVSWLKRWPRWPTVGLALYGHAGCGKTHLGHLWRQQANAYQINERDFNADPSQLLRHGRAFLIDAAARLSHYPAWGFHFFNLVREAQGSILLLENRPPAHWHISLPDLKSRLLMLPAIAIGEPDEALLSGIALKCLHDRGVRIRPEALKYLITHIPRHYGTLSQVVAYLDYLSLQQQRAVTVPLVRQALASKCGQSLLDGFTVDLAKNDDLPPLFKEAV